MIVKLSFKLAGLIGDYLSDYCKTQHLYRESYKGLKDVFKGFADKVNLLFQLIPFE